MQVIIVIIIMLIIYELNDLINNILQMNFENIFLFKNEIGSLLIINFDKINIIFKHSSAYSNNNNNSNQSSSFFMFDELRRRDKYK